MSVLSKKLHIPVVGESRIRRVFCRAAGPTAFAVVVISGVLALSSCSIRAALGQTGGDVRQSGQSGHGQISLSITDTPVDGAQQVVVAFTGIDLNGPSGTVPEHFASEKRVDLLSLQGDASAKLLSDVAVEAGTYQWMRLDLDLSHSYIELDNGRVYPLRVPSGSHTGLKLVSGFTVAQGGKAAFMVDFDLRRSLTMTTTEKIREISYILKPTMRLTDLQQVGSVSGYAAANLEIGGTSIGAAGCSPAVYVYEGKGITPEGYDTTVTGGTPPLTSTNLIPDSSTGDPDYTAAFLAPGTYTLAATCAAYDTAGASVLAFSAVKTATVTANSAITVNFPAPVKYTVTYDRNGATGGSVPVDSGRYLQGASVTVLGNTGGLVRSGTTFTGWNTAPDGSGTSYAAGATFSMGSANVTLYAEWASYLYVPNEHSATVSAFTIGSSGALSAITGTFSTGSLPSVAAATPNGEFLYTANGDNTVSAFTVASDGALQSIGNPVATGSGPYGIAVSPNGEFLYTTNYSDDTVSAFSIASNGALQSIGTPVATGSGPYGIAVSPNGEFLYTVNYGDNSVSAFTVASDGTLSSIAGTSTGARSGPYAIAISPNGEFLYTANIGNDTVSVFSIGSSGALSLIPGTSSFPTGSGPYGIAISPNGEFLYTANSLDDTVSAFSIASSGALSSIGGTFTTGKAPFGIAVSPNGKFLYTTNAGDNTVSAFSIGSSGVPGAISGTFTTGQTPLGIAITP